MGDQIIRPQRLHQGDIVGLVAPGGRISHSMLDIAMANLEDLGLRGRPGASIHEVDGNYAGAVAQRRADLHAMFADPSIKAIWCLRGGAGCIGLLSSLDYALIQNNPKILLGYSDITALHLAIWRKTALISFHGPVAGVPLTRFSAANMLSILSEGEPERVLQLALPPSVAQTTSATEARAVRTGTAQGRLIGGNLSILSALMGTPYAPEFAGALLILEEVNEPPYKIDRWLTQLQLAQDFSALAGVMMGICRGCEPSPGPTALSLAEIFDRHFSGLVVPSMAGCAFGHINDQLTLPIGVMARLDTSSSTITLLESPVA